MITLQGQSYYEITDEAVFSSDGEGFEINPFNSNGTIIPRIQVNFVLSAGIRLPNPLLTLPNLSLLKGNWNVEIVITSDGSVAGSEISIFSPNFIDRYEPEATYVLETTLGVILTGISSSNYIGGVGIIRPNVFPPRDPVDPRLTPVNPPVETI